MEEVEGDGGSLNRGGMEERGTLYRRGRRRRNLNREGRREEKKYKSQTKK